MHAMRIPIDNALTDELPPPGTLRGATDTLASIAAIVLVSLLVACPWIAQSVTPDRTQADTTPAETAKAQPHAAEPQAGAERETFIAGYAGWPVYYRSNVRLTRPDGTDVELKRLGWDGDALYFPLDGGVRSVQWSQSFGLMVDFLHNKAIARLGKGAHGRRLADPVVEEVEAAGSIKGQPAPQRLRLTEMFERFEFTHGHNVLLLTPLLRLGSISPNVRPYVGIGAGLAIPHVEVWSPGESREQRTNEYQFAGPAAQAVAGLELRTGKVSYFIEYKFTLAWISGALTGDQSWLNFNMPGDLWRQFGRWWRGEAPKYGRFSTRLAAHQVVAGAGYWWNRRRPVN